jgi:hypothetical protein
MRYDSEHNQWYPSYNGFVAPGSTTLVPAQAPAGPHDTAGMPPVRWKRLKLDVLPTTELRLKLYAKKVGVRHLSEAHRIALEREFQRAGV